MKKLLPLFLFLFCTAHSRAETFYDQLCAINPNWKHFSFCVPFNESKIFSSDQEFIRTHLTAVENLLRSKNVKSLSLQEQSVRKKNLDVLHDYIRAGIFPQNYYKTFRTPVFIDEHGTHCAVGYLMMSSGHDDLARRISAKDNYVFVKNIDDPELLDWQQTSGFSVEELALIQPEYGYAVSPISIRQVPSCGTRYFEDIPVSYASSSPAYVWNFKGVKQPKPEPKPKHVWCKGECNNGVLNGKWIQYRNEKEIWVEGNFVNGKKSGTWIVYWQHAEGVEIIDSISHWVNGKLDGLVEVFDYYGKKVCEGHYVNGLKEGEWKTWENSLLATQYNYHNGKLNGEYFTYFHFSSKDYADREQVAEHSVYADDVLQTQKTFYYNGKLRSEKKLVSDSVYESANYGEEGKLYMEGREFFSFVLMPYSVQIQSSGYSKPMPIPAFRKTGIWWVYGPHAKSCAGYYVEGDTSKIYFENDSVRAVVRINPANTSGVRDSIIYVPMISYYSQETHWCSDTHYETEGWTWIDGKLIAHTAKWPDGSTKFGFSFNKDGIFLGGGYYTETGQPLEVWTGETQNDKLVLHYVKYDERGKLLMAGYMQDSTVRCGKWAFWDTAGTVTSAGDYKDNLKSGEWYELDTPTVGITGRGEYKKGVKDGKWEERDAKTNKYAVGNYKQGRKVGVWKYYNAKGKLEHKEKFGK